MLISLPEEMLSLCESPEWSGTEGQACSLWVQVEDFGQRTVKSFSAYWQAGGIEGLVRIRAAWYLPAHEKMTDLCFSCKRQDPTLASASFSDDIELSLWALGSPLEGMVLIPWGLLLEVQSSVRILN